MFTLFHHPFCPHSRFIRLIAGEYGLDLKLVEERSWERREAFLLLNAAGTTPVLVDDEQPPIPGAAIIAEYVDEAYGAEMGVKRLMPETIADANGWRTLKTSGSSMRALYVTRHHQST